MKRLVAGVALVLSAAGCEIHANIASAAATSVDGAPDPVAPASVTLDAGGTPSIGLSLGSSALATPRVGQSFALPLVFHLSNAAGRNVASFDVTLAVTGLAGARLDSLTAVAPGWFAILSADTARVVGFAFSGFTATTSPLTLWYTVTTPGLGTITPTPLIVADELGNDLTAIAHARATLVWVRR